MKPIEPLHVNVRFGPGIPVEVYGTALLQFEKYLRALANLPCEVFQDRAGDDSKLRAAMTPQQRAKL